MAMRYALVFAALILVATGCTSEEETGAAIGSGIGALAGNLIDGKQLTIYTGDVRTLSRRV